MVSLLHPPASFDTARFRRSFILFPSLFERFLFHYLLLYDERFVLSIISMIDFSVYFLPINKESVEEENGKI